MRVYQPQLDVTLIKSNHRTNIIGSLPAAQVRYQGLYGINITQYLGDGSVVQTTKSTRQPCGGFHIKFADMPLPNFLESIYALIEPMDIVEIRMVHDVSTLPSGGKISLVMRGLVTGISRGETMNGDKPQRHVSITGHDFAKFMQIYRIQYFPFTPESVNALNDFRFFQTYAPEGANKAMSGNDFVNLVASKILTPFMSAITAISNASALGATQLNNWTTTGTGIDGNINPIALNGYNDNTIYEIMHELLDIGPFNEMFVQDTEAGPNLVVRPIPFRDGKGNFIQGSTTFLDIPSADIVSQSVYRSDEAVANYYWVGVGRASIMLGLDWQAMAYSVGNGDFVQFNYQNCLRSVFGTRKLEVSTNMDSIQSTFSNANKQADNNKEGKNALTWVDKRRTLLVSMNKDNAVFEQGSLRLRGNEAIQAGIYLNLHRGVGQQYVGEVYAHTVTHEFMPFHGFYTTVQFDRGTMFINRTQIPNNPYIGEIEAQGAI